MVGVVERGVDIEAPVVCIEGEGFDRRAYMTRLRLEDFLASPPIQRDASERRCFSRQRSSKVGRKTQKEKWASSSNE